MKDQDKKEKKDESIFSLLGGIFGPSPEKHDMNSWEKDAIKNDGYEPHNFEEEELEEDDYYYEDDK